LIFLPEFFELIRNKKKFRDTNVVTLFREHTPNINFNWIFAIISRVVGQDGIKV